MEISLALLSLAITSIAVVVVVFSLISILKGAPYVRTSNVAIEQMLESAQTHANKRFIDLGSGDGKILLAFAKAGFISYGYEINPFLVLITKLRIQRAGLQGKAFVQWKNLWSAHLNSFDVIVVYGMPHIMGDLEKKLKKEVRPGSLVLSNHFRFPTLKLLHEKNNILAYVTT